MNPKRSYPCVLPPGAELTVPFDPPLTDSDDAVVLGRPGEIVMVSRSTRSVTIHNTTKHVAGGQLVVIPALVGKLVRAPWNEIKDRAQQELKKWMKELGLGS